LERIVRVGVTFPPKLLSELDDLAWKAGYPNRSKAIQDSVRSFLSEQKWLQGVRGRKVGVITLVYDHHATSVQQYLTRVQHMFRHSVAASTHVHLDERDCLEAIVVQGEAAELRKLVKKLETRKGVKQVKLTVVST
jgi:CopG family nickel-responsive transcriptional regulator